MSSSRLLARNTALNLLGQVVPMLAALVTIPILIHRLGASRFGVLTLVWAAIGYFSLFDLGLGRSLTQAVAVRLGSADGEDDLTEVVWSALWLMLALGAAGGLLLAGAAPWIVQHGLKVPPELQRETLVAFYLLLLSLPIVVSTAGLRGLLEAHQHFGLGIALRIPLALFTFVAPLAVLPFSTRLGPIVGILCIGRVIAWIAHLAVCMRQYEYLRRGMRIRFRVLGPLVRTGGWMTVSNIVSPAMSYLDRFFIGAILPLAAVAHYVTPYEVVMKLLVFPAALVGAFFPAFAATFVTNRIRTAALFEQSIRAVVLLMFPPLLVIVLFAHEGLTAWVGPAFAHESATVLQWLTVGVFVNALAQAPFTVLQGIGRPDLTARLHLAEGPVYVVALWILAHRYGIVGVAAAWTLRAGIDLAALLVLTMRVVPDPDRRLDRTLLFSAGALGVLGLAAAVQGVPFKALYGAIVLAGFGILGWTRLVNPAERALIATWTRRLLARPVPQT